MPAMWPSSSAAPCIGVSERRSRKPVRMSAARSAPAPPMAKRPACMHGTASANVR